MGCDHCWSGREIANPAGPCPNEPAHAVGSTPPGKWPTMHFCEDHFKIVYEMGLISQPYVGVWVDDKEIE